MIPPIYFIVGPTAIGKSKLALDLAKKINGHIINADSMQVYKDLNVLTARPSKKEIKQINHHLYGYIKSNDRYNVARWCEDASRKIKKLSEKKIPSILVGGTGMYIDKLINGLVDIPTIPEEYKYESEKALNKMGISNFYKLISSFDDESLSKININDINRLKRIWEVYTFTKVPLSNWIKNKSKKYIENFNYFIFLFQPDRSKNYERVDNRFIKMMNEGAIQEVENLLTLNLENSLPIMKAHGVPEIIKYLDKQITIEECINLSQQVTRNYVKRQHTWWGSTNLEIHQQIKEFPDEIELNSIKMPIS